MNTAATEPKAQPGPSELRPEPERRRGSVTEEVAAKTIRLHGFVPPEVWNRLGTKVLPKLRSGSNLGVRIELSVTLNRNLVRSLGSELRQILDDLELSQQVQITEE